MKDVERVAKKYITPDKLAIVIVGDAAELLPQVESYSDKIEIFDTEGNPVDIASYENSLNGEAVNVGGEWNLTVDFQGQKLTVNLTLEQEAGKI